MESAKPDRLLRPAQVETVLGVTRTTLREWDKDGTFPADQRTLGGHRRWRESRVEAKAAELRPSAVAA